MGLSFHGVKGGGVYEKKRGYELVLSHRDSVALFELMYNTNCRGLYLTRKYKLFRRAIDTLYKNRI